MKRRDKYVVWLVNRVLWFASPRYKLLVLAAIEAAILSDDILAALNQDTEEGDHG